MTPEPSGSGFDLIVDKQNQPVAVVVVKEQPIGGAWTSYLPGQPCLPGRPVPFVLLVDPNSVSLFRWDGSAFTGPVVQLPTADVLRPYEPEYGRRRILQADLQTLVEAWLRDLAHHWSSQGPPGMEELRKAGLLDELEGGTPLSTGG